MATQLEFDAQTHTYRHKGRVVPSVTTILRATLPMWQAAPWYLQKGRAVHKGCQLLDEGVLDWQTVDPEIRGCILAWQRFLKESGATVESIESPGVSEAYQFAGTRDRMLWIEGERVLCDMKSTITAAVRPQLGAYSLLCLVKPVKGVAVELRNDGRFRTLWLDKHELKRSEQTFLACLTVFNFMNEHRLAYARVQ